jgi:hypothetical protein
MLGFGEFVSATRHREYGTVGVPCGELREWPAGLIGGTNTETTVTGAVIGMMITVTGMMIAVTGQAIDPTGQAIDLTGQAIDLTGHLPRREKSELTKSVKTMSIATAMAMSTVRQSKDGSSAVVVAGQNLMPVHASQVVDQVPVNLTLTVNPRPVKEGRVELIIISGQGVLVEVEALVAAEAEDLADVVRVISIGNYKELDKSMTKTEGRI